MRADLLEGSKKMKTGKQKKNVHKTLKNGGSRRGENRDIGGGLAESRFSRGRQTVTKGMKGWGGEGTWDGWRV